MPADVASFVRRRDAGGKFVVILSPSDAEGGTVVFSDFTRDAQHRDIVLRWAGGREDALAGSRVRVAGGGWWKYVDGILILHGLSVEYGSFDRRWMEARLRPGTVMGERAIEIR